MYMNQDVIVDVKRTTMNPTTNILSVDVGMVEGWELHVISIIGSVVTIGFI